MRSVDNPDLSSVQPGDELMHYSERGRFAYREAPQLVRRVQVKRVTKTQVVIAIASRGEGAEERYYKDGGHVVGGGYDSAQLRAVDEQAERDERESKLRREVHVAVGIMTQLARQLDNERVATGPIEVVEAVAPMLRAANDQLQGVMAVLKAKESK